MQLYFLARQEDPENGFRINILPGPIGTPIDGTGEPMQLDS